MIQTIIETVEDHCEFTLQQINTNLIARQPNKCRKCENSNIQANTEAVKIERSDRSADEKVYMRWLQKAFMDLQKDRELS